MAYIKGGTHEHNHRTPAFADSMCIFGYSRVNGIGIKAVIQMEHDELESYISDEIDSRYSVARIPNWHENANYLVGDKVKFSGAIYRCKQSHVSIQDWTPTATQALWVKTMTGV